MSEETKYTEYEAAYAAGMAATAGIKLIEWIDPSNPQPPVGKVPIAMVPNGIELRDLSSMLLSNPNAIYEQVDVDTIESFANYCEIHEDEPYVYYLRADEKRRHITTIFDMHGAGKPRWQHHSVRLRLDFSSEFENFRPVDGRLLSPTEFAEFIEDNINYLLGSDDTELDDVPSPASILAMAQNIRVELRGRSNISVSLKDGRRVIDADSGATVSGKYGSDVVIPFPEKLYFKLRIFHKQDEFPIWVYLRTRNVDDKVLFSIKIPSIEQIIEAAFDEVVRKLQDKTQHTLIRVK